MTTIVTVGGMTVYSAAVPDAGGVMRAFSILKGWEGGGPVKGQSLERAQSDGAFAERAFRAGRTIVLGGVTECPTRALAAAEALSLSALLGDGSFGDFVVDDPDMVTLRSSVRHGIEPMVEWDNHYMIEWQFGFLAPDPLRYGDWVTASTGFLVVSGGLRFPLYSDGDGADLGALDYGVSSTTGTLTLTNPGTATTPIQHVIAGPVDADGFDIINTATGRRLTYQGSIPTGSSLVLDGRTGAVLLDGQSERGTLLTSRDWPVCAAGASVSLFFRYRGGIADGTLTSSLAPAYR